MRAQSYSIQCLDLNNLLAVALLGWKISRQLTVLSAAAQSLLLIECKYFVSTQQWGQQIHKHHFLSLVIVYLHVKPKLQV